MTLLRYVYANTDHRGHRVQLLGRLPKSPLVEKYLLEGKLAEGEKALAEAVAAKPTDAQARFGLGVIQFVGAVERHGPVVSPLWPALRRRGRHAAVRPASHPRQSRARADRYADLRAFFERWTDDLATGRGNARQGRRSADVKLPLHFGLIRLDLNGDGKAEPDERLFTLYAQLNAAARNQVNAEAAKDFLITFDRADVAWLRGYCHLLMAMSEVYLAHDAHELFDHTAPYFYPKARNPVSLPETSADRRRPPEVRHRRLPGRHRIHPPGSISSPGARSAEIGPGAPGVDDRPQP